ncbi:hypothetical protein J7T55_009522 [Diaporthe amygdali]|uniref:uncharacterized protein n=1 Tax=Phomopsis amygdali TaxID=1214568 RepID=UPI0022FF33F8|nr:uncharacterized protein J7T55_009522 [Diaporthe amygdali]KAJ0109191.1 hypothetical protein J7T55_009522 [Diaporthe amygdali]
MSSSKQVDAVDTDAGEGSSSSLAVAKPESTAAPAERRSTLPPVLQFPLVAILSFSISSLGYSFINEFTQGELATIMRTLETPRELGIMTAWRLTELALGWFANFDSIDLAALNLLSHSPTFYLMAAFYNLSTKTAIAGLTVDVIASFVPFLLLRPLSAAHKSSSSTPNREIIADKPIQVLSTLLASFIYSVVLFLSYKTFLPGILVLYFIGIPTVEPLHSATSIYVSPLATTLALASGIAARSFIFTPLAATGRTEADEKAAQFDPVNASLGETLWWNIWGYTTQTKVGVARTIVLMVVTGINTTLQGTLTISGVEATGAAVYASIWVVAAFFTGVGLGAVGEV